MTETQADHVQNQLCQRIDDLQVDKEALAAQLDASEQLVERLRQEAIIHAQEARTHKATVHEIYRLISGGRGELGNWHGAEPVRDLIAERDGLQRLANCRAEQRDALAASMNAVHEAASGLAKALSPQEAEIALADLESAMSEADSNILARRDLLKQAEVLVEFGYLYGPESAVRMLTQREANKLRRQAKGGE